MLVIGDTIKFKSNCGLRVDSNTRFRYEGAAFKRGGGRTEHAFMALDGAREGGVFRITMPGTKSITDYVSKVRKLAEDNSKAEAVNSAKLERENKSIDALQGVQMGDLITVSIATSMGVSTYDFKVYEVDYRQLRVKGYKPNTDPGSRKGWINVAHKDVSFAVKTKNFFDPRTDQQALTHDARAQAANTKRQATKRRRAELREIFG